MPRDNSTNARQMRLQIAHLAARLMAVDGIDDFALAKRKAARQAGAPDSRNLPTNDEILEALRAYQQLYQSDEQTARLRHLRQRALHMLQLLAAFNPFLSGSVASGHAGKYADIDVHLFTDNVKEVELFFLNREFHYKSGERRVFVGGGLRSVPQFHLSLPDADFNVTVFAATDLRQPLRSTAEGRPFERVRADWLESVLEGNPSSPA
jgi:hypothetical protein